MTLYRAKPSDGIAWITGASTGIGRALALELVRRGYVVAATARGEDKLVSLANEASALYGRIVPFPGDVTDQAGMAAIAQAIERELGPVVLAVFNAGNYFPTKGEKLTVENFVKTYEINLFGIVNGLVPVVDAMKARGFGQVAVVGSVSGYGGLPLASAYGASKSAVNNMAEALKFDFDKMNIRIQVVNPGFVDTPLTEKNDFPMPGLMKVEDATRRFADGLERGGFEVCFPRRLAWTLKLVNLLPHALYFPIMKRAMGWNKRPLKP
ncbi:SDR family NAD(P)-dependent oxidoreductase [Aquibium carbonis]|uniref:SDR family NAD(P)-dependent oxidoreductase n=1 Tax=Aquibium carbonis TaxID=2495581 RepID=A0A429Z287_9HYPH|nr:SDR family NAD(P)-dependent oxidoreductase [Aquibium carbonis]RST87819.1 SDR family NAD(P)-dependent oxidoreductase [Aquibium carbonis]